MKPLKNWTITSHYGDRIHPKTKKKSFHNGIDLKAGTGTNIYSPWAGKVIMIDLFNDDSGGLQIRILHENGYTTGYAHLSEIFVVKGQVVEEGNVIAKTGNSGVGTGPHLHFTLRELSGETIDPETIFI